MPRATLKLCFVLAVLFQASSLFAAHSNRPFVIDFYQRVLACKNLTLECLNSQGLIQEISPQLFIFRDVRRGEKHEVQSAVHIVDAIGFPILLCPHLPNYHAFPVIDAIVFSKEGLPIANLSIKSFINGATVNAATSARMSIAEARDSLKKWYSLQGFASGLGFDVNRFSELVERTGMMGKEEKEFRTLLLRGLFRLTGLRPYSKRPVWLAFDFSYDPYRMIEILNGNENKHRVPIEGNYLNFYDLRASEQPMRPPVLHVESLVQRSRKKKEFKKYIFITTRTVLDVDEFGFQLSPRSFDDTSDYEADQSEAFVNMKVKRVPLGERQQCSDILSSSLDKASGF